MNTLEITHDGDSKEQHIRFTCDIDDENIPCKKLNMDIECVGNIFVDNLTPDLFKNGINEESFSELINL